MAANYEMKVDAPEKLVQYDNKALAVMNGTAYMLSQLCSACLCRFVGNQNFKFCPECGTELPHVVEPGQRD